MMIDGHKDRTVEERKLIWDEENRLLAVDENGFVSNYWYDANGERTVKTSGENEAIYVNSEFSGGNTGTARFSLYVSPYLVAGQGGKYTKHIYIGSQRIVSKLGDLASYGADPRRIPYAGNEADGLTINYKDKYAQQLQSIKDNYKTFDIPYTGKDNNDYVNGQGFCCDDGTPEAAQARAMARAAIDGNFKPNEEYEKMQFYYHPDHLGSSSYITNLDGEVSQHIEYVPFGEVFIEERDNTWNTPYLFNAKEFDEETGLYYYGARYYDPRLSLWMSTDPLQEKYPNISPYCYTVNNPLKFIDPTGMDWVENNDTGDITWNKNVTSAENTPDGFTYRGSTYERERIWTNQIVDGNRESGLMLESYNTDGNMTYKNLTPWIDAAFEELGTARFEGEASNPRIEEYLTHTQLTGAAINDKTSWCAGFANFALESREIEGTGSAMALSFRHFGESLDNPAYGSIATISYGGGKGHVGFVVGKNSNGQIPILGGNQGAAKKGGQNEVNISPNSASKFKYNYPAGHKPYYNLPVLNIKGKAVSYETTR